MQQLKDHIIRLLSEMGKREHTEEYQLCLSKNTMMSELSLLGFNYETATKGLEDLCANGTLAIDESNIYQYENPPA